MKFKKTISKTLGLLMVALFSVLLISQNNKGFFAKAEENIIEKQSMPKKASDLDLKYKAAYDATMTVTEKANKHGVKAFFDPNNGGVTPTSKMVAAVKDNLQEDINTARDAIEALPKHMETAIGRFSEIVDDYQHPVYERIVTVINELIADDTKLTQAEINAIRTLIFKAPDFIDNNGNQARPSYSSKLDECQTKLHKRAEGFVDKALVTKNPSDINLARKAIEELKTNEFLDNAINTFIAGLESKLDDSFDVIGIE